MTTAGDEWPLFLYHGYSYDSKDPWNGLFRSALLVTVSLLFLDHDAYFWSPKAYKHIFTSPSSVDKEPKATHSGNARIHGMTCVSLPSLAYVATQVPTPLLFGSQPNCCFYRSDFPLACHLCSPGQTWQPTLSVFTIPFSSFSKTQKNVRK